MSNQTIKGTDTTRSWRAMRKVFCLIVSIWAGVCGFGGFLSNWPNWYDWFDPIRIIEGIGLGLLAGIVGWFGAWLLIVIVAFLWWFILDRIREFVRAVKGQP